MRFGSAETKRARSAKPADETALERLLHRLDPALYGVLERARKRIERELRSYREDLRAGDLTEVTQVLLEAFADTVREAVEMYEERILARLPATIRAPIERLLRVRQG